MEESLPLPPVKLDPRHWQPVSPGGELSWQTFLRRLIWRRQWAETKCHLYSAIPPEAASMIADLLSASKRPLVITSWIGNDHLAAAQLLQLCERLQIPVLDHSPFALNFPTTHPLYLGSHWSGSGQNNVLAEADVVLIIDSDVPYIPTQNKPNEDATIIHIDCDPLKAAMPLFYISANHRFAANSTVALRQINAALDQTPGLCLDKASISARAASIAERTSIRAEALKLAKVPTGKGLPENAAVAISVLAGLLPDDSFVVSEAISK